MEKYVLFPRSLGVFALTALLLGTQRAPVAHAPACANCLIVNLEHGDIHFAVWIDPANDQYLALHVSEKQPDNGPYRVQRPVKVEIFFRDEKRIAGAAEFFPVAASNGGYAELNYRFNARRSVTADNIHSITVSLGDQDFTMFPGPAVPPVVPWPPASN